MSIKFKRSLEWFLLTLLVSLLAIAGSLFVYQNSYAGKIYKNVTVAGIDVSGKSKKQAEALLDKKFDAVLSRDIKFQAGEKQVSAKLSDTGINFDIESSVSNAYAVGRSNHFLPQLYASAQTTVKNYQLVVPIVIDSTKLNFFITDKLPGLSVAPVDASISISNGTVNILEGVNGQTINTSNLAADLSKLTSQGVSNPVIVLHVISTPPAVTATDLFASKQQIEQTIAKKITLNYESASFTPSASEISKWLNFSVSGEQGKIDISENSIKTYLSQIAKSFEIAKKDRKINASDGTVLEEGVQGKYLDKNKASQSIKNFLISNQSTIAIELATYTEDPKEVRVFPAEGIIPGKYPGKYIDVDLTQQKLCRIDGNSVLDCFIISSGKPSMPTPVGTRYIENKSPKQWSAKYSLWMPWWQSLGGGYGIHELPEWPNGYKEGEAHLGTPVSHGCVRLGIGAAETVYNWTEVGMPVYIHK